MLRTINHTKRRKIDRKECMIDFDELNGTFTADFSGLQTNMYPEDSRVSVIAYRFNTSQRFEFGSVGNINPP